VLQAVTAEAIKLKRSSTLVLLAVGALLPAVTNSMYPGTSGWERYSLMSLLFLNLSSFIVVSSLGGYLFSREYEKGTISAILTSRVSRLTLLGAKFVVLIPLVAAMYLVCMLLSFGWGVIRMHGLPTEAVLLKRYAAMALGLLGMHLCLAPASLLAGILGKKTVVPIIVGLAFTLLYGTFVFTETGSYLPPCLPTLFLLHTSGVNPYGVSYVYNAGRTALLFSATFVVFSCSAALVFVKKEQVGA
jgi:ABC-type transport system involved in multi-copper enzyme maturation permease subunit